MDTQVATLQAQVQDLMHQFDNRGPPPTVRNNLAPQMPVTMSRAFCQDIQREVVTLAPATFDHLPKYSGEMDPRQHIKYFTLQMEMSPISEAAACRVFILTLVGAAQDWFLSLPEESVWSFSELMTQFLQAFATQQRVDRAPVHLLKPSYQRGLEESLHDYLSRFNQACTETPGLSLPLRINALLHGLQYGPLAAALMDDPPATHGKLRKICGRHIRLEEMMKPPKREKIYPDPRAHRRTWQPEERRHNPPTRALIKKVDVNPRGQKYTEYHLFRTTRSDILRAIGPRGLLVAPRGMKPSNNRKNPGRYCLFHKDNGHSTEDCINLKDELERLAREGHLGEWLHPNTTSSGVKCPRTTTSNRYNEESDPGGKKPRIAMITGGCHEIEANRARKRKQRRFQQIARINPGPPRPPIQFSDDDLQTSEPHNHPMVISTEISEYIVDRIFIDQGSASDILSLDAYQRMGLDITDIQRTAVSLKGFGGVEVNATGTVELLTTFGQEPQRKTLPVIYLVVEAPFSYNVILGRPSLFQLKAIVSTYHMVMKFPTDHGTGQVRANLRVASICYEASLNRNSPRKDGSPQSHEESKMKIPRTFQISEPGSISPPEFKEISIARDDPGKIVRIGAELNPQVEIELIRCLRDYADVFAWTATDFPGISPSVAVHRLNINPGTRPVQQKKKALRSRKIIKEEVKKLLQAGYGKESNTHNGSLMW